MWWSSEPECNSGRGVGQLGTGGNLSEGRGKELFIIRKT